MWGLLAKVGNTMVLLMHVFLSIPSNHRPVDMPLSGSVESYDTSLSNRPDSWGLSCQCGSGKDAFAVGDVIGVTYDLSDLRPWLKFYQNGSLVKTMEIRDKRSGEVFPAVSVEQGCMLKVNFGHAEFECDPPSMFDAVIMSRDLM